MRRLTRRRRRIVALLALLALLFQQVAMAAYACPMEETSAPAASAPCHAPRSADAARCHEHCHPLTAASDHAPAPLATSALPSSPDWDRVLALVPDRALAAPRIFARGADPPLDVRFCSFQI